MIRYLLRLLRSRGGRHRVGVVDTSMVGMTWGIMRPGVALCETVRSLYGDRPDCQHPDR
jgi:hypothetical protein